MMSKPYFKFYSPACDRNKEALLEVLGQHLKSSRVVFEVGSGTAQHAVYFTKKLPLIKWLLSDCNESHKKINENIKNINTERLSGPFDYKAGSNSLPTLDFDFVYSANTLHIMSWDEALCLFKDLARKLHTGSKVFFYGPFNYKSKFTSVSNQVFDKQLKSRDPSSGLRSFESVHHAMGLVGFELIDNIAMPANNRSLVFIKK